MAPPSRSQGLDVLIVSGIWPPDVGGPASHGPDLGRFLLEAGHRVQAVTAYSGTIAGEDPFPVRRLRRNVPVARRLAEGGAEIARLARDADVIYATSMYSRAAAAARVTRVPVVMKIVNDPAYERARNWGRFAGGLEEFQEQPGGAVIRGLRVMRDASLRTASEVFAPSEYLRRLARGWRFESERMRVIPNPLPAIGELPPPDELRARLGLDAPTVVFTGRFVTQKNVPLAVAALARTPEVRLVLIGDGPEQGRVQEEVERQGVRDRVSIMPAMPRSQALEWVRAADAAVLPSDWENLPHAALEAMAVGTPVVATAVGGVPEIVEQGRDGLLVPPGRPEALAEAIEAVVLRGELRNGGEPAQSRLERYSEQTVFSSIAGLIEAAAGRR